MLEVAKIKLDGGTQTRVGITEEIVASYAERMEEGDKFPPVVVYFDGTYYYLADGFHRVLAAQRLRFRDIEAAIHKGTRLDALQCKTAK